jgi:hypothetical protein
MSNFPSRPLGSSRPELTGRHAADAQATRHTLSVSSPHFTSPMHRRSRQRLSPVRSLCNDRESILTVHHAPVTGRRLERHQMEASRETPSPNHRQYHLRL